MVGALASQTAIFIFIYWSLLKYLFVFLDICCVLFEFWWHISMAAFTSLNLYVQCFTSFLSSAAASITTAARDKDQNWLCFLLFVFLVRKSVAFVTTDCELSPPSLTYADNGDWYIQFFCHYGYLLICFWWFLSMDVSMFSPAATVQKQVTLWPQATADKTHCQLM